MGLRGLLSRTSGDDTGQQDRSRSADPYPSEPTRRPSNDGVPGREADTPTEIPAAGWKQVLKRA